MPIRMTKPWLPLDAEHLRQVKAQLGVFQLGSDQEGVTFIGCADARSLFGLRGELQARLDAGDSRCFRVEVTTAYATRYRELLMVHHADHGAYPRDNPVETLPRLGRLSPA